MTSVMPAYVKAFNETKVERETESYKIFFEDRTEQDTVFIRIVRQPRIVRQGSWGSKKCRIEIPF